MGGHKLWRKIAKKTRRKRIRKKLALVRIEMENREKEALASSSQYQACLQEQAKLDESTKTESDRIAKEALSKWEETERIFQLRWKERQELAKKETEKAELQQARVKKDWEKEQMKIKEQAEKQAKEELKKREEAAMLAAEIDLFISGELRELPSVLNVPIETQPGKEACPFYQKVGACRFMDGCSRNHVKPGISKTILFPGFYSHFSLSSLRQKEYDTDISLEYDHYEQYKHFKEFYEDIKIELETYGTLSQLKVCLNQEAHLRGNVYAEYTEERASLNAYRRLNGRYYAGKIISAQFVTIPSWSKAICGLFFKKTCPKGNSCNFLHVFRNPHGEFNYTEPANPSTPKKSKSTKPPKPKRSKSRERESKKKPKEGDEWRWSGSSGSDGSERSHRRSRSRKHSSKSRSRHRRDTDSSRHRDERKSKSAHNGYKRSKR